MKTIFAAVSFESTPLMEIGPKANEILKRGWEFYEKLPNRWVAKFRKDFPDGTPAQVGNDELREIMGNLWVEIS